MRRMASLVVCLTTLTTTSVARQPAPLPPEPVIHAVALDPEIAIHDLRSAYTTEVIDQDLTITVKRTGTPSRTADARLRTTPDHQFVLRLGDLVLWTTPSALRAVDSREPGKYYEFPLDLGDRATGVYAALPPLPIPQIALSLSTNDEARDLTPYTRSIRWTIASLDAAVKPACAVIMGEGERCTVTLVIDAERSWLREFTAVVGDRELELSVTCSEPRQLNSVKDGATPDPLTPPEIVGQTRVKRLSDLRPAQTEEGNAALGASDVISR